LTARRGWQEVGGRRVELRFCGRGHTDTELVVPVPDAEAVRRAPFTEEAARQALERAAATA
jgi:hypothetical protein